MSKNDDNNSSSSKQSKTKINKSTKNVKKCEWVNQKDGPCPWKSLGSDKSYCEAHSKYEGKYTKNDIPNMKRCSGCKNLWMEDGINKTCDECRANKKESRLKEKKDNEENTIKCKGLTQKGTPCNSQANDNDEYCGKHQSYKIYKQTIDSGKNICKNWSRGCFEIIPNEKKTCSNCRKKEQTQENANNLKKKNKATEYNNSNEKNKMCIECNKIVELNEYFNSKCKRCYETYKKNEKNRKRNAE
jgi:hypothetical protein